MSGGHDIDRPWELDFETELKAQRRAEWMLMLRGAVILLTVTALVLLRAMLL